MAKFQEKSLKETSRLPEIDQNGFGKWMRGDLESERKWEKAFAGSEDILDRLADKALAAHGRGETKPLKAKDL